MNELAEDWPTKEWGKKDLSQIAVLAAYRYQVRCLVIFSADLIVKIQPHRQNILEKNYY